MQQSNNSNITYDESHTTPKGRKRKNESPLVNAYLKTPRLDFRIKNSVSNNNEDLKLSNLNEKTPTKISVTSKNEKMLILDVHVKIPQLDIHTKSSPPNNSQDFKSSANLKEQTPQKLSQKSTPKDEEKLTANADVKIGKVDVRAGSPDISQKPKSAANLKEQTPQKSSEDGEKMTSSAYVKIQKLDDQDSKSLANVEKKTPLKVRKKLTEDEEKQKQMKFIQRFVEISTKYSQFLANKITEVNPKPVLSEKTQNASTSKDSKTNENQVCSDVEKRLKYFTGQLIPYQLEGVTWLTVLFENSVNGILADEMGLGKTIQVIALISHLYERNVPGPYLIVVPLSTLGNWMSEFEKFAPKIPVVRFQGVLEERNEQMRHINTTKFKLDGKQVRPVMICTYQVPQLASNFLRQFKWQYIIIDEGHRIKNPESKLFQELQSLKSLNRLLLTGTPLQNDIKELWALFNFLMPELFTDIKGFSSLLLLQDMEDKGKLLQTEAKTHLISTIHSVLSPFILRREKKYVMTDLTPKKEVLIYCPLTKLQKYIYKAILENDVVALRMENLDKSKDENLKGARKRRSCTLSKKGYNKWDIDDDIDLKCVLKEAAKQSKLLTNKYVPVECPDTLYYCSLTMTNNTMMCKKVVNHPYLIWYPLDSESGNTTLLINEDLVKYSGKLMVLDALLPKLQAGGHKVLIFSTLVLFLELVEEFLIMRKIKYCMLTGDTNYQTRNENIDQFNKDPSVLAFLLSTRAGGLGLNLTAADTIIFLDRDWNPMVDIQAMARCHRIGQTKPVMVLTLVAKNSIDEIIIKRGEMKKRLEKIVLKEGHFKELVNRGRNFTESELKELEDLLNSEENLEKVHLNGLFYSDEELDQILDRSDML